MTLDAWARNFGMPFDPPHGGEDAYFEAQEVAEGFIENGGNGNVRDIVEYLTGFSGSNGIPKFLAHASRVISPPPS